MLPFLDPKKSSSVIMSRRGKSPDMEVNTEVQAPGSEIDPGLMAAAEDILRAIEIKSPIDLAKALKSAMSLGESMEGDES